MQQLRTDSRCGSNIDIATSVVVAADCERLCHGLSNLIPTLTLRLYENQTERVSLWMAIAKP